MNEYWGRYQVPIMVTENGLGAFGILGADGSIHDDYRIRYYAQHIAETREAIRDGVNLVGYFPWGPIDIVGCCSSDMEKPRAPLRLFR